MASIKKLIENNTMIWAEGSEGACLGGHIDLVKNTLASEIKTIHAWIDIFEEMCRRNSQHLNVIEFVINKITNAAHENNYDFYEDIDRLSISILNERLDIIRLVPPPRSEAGFQNILLYFQVACERQNIKMCEYLLLYVNDYRKAFLAACKFNNITIAKHILKVSTSKKIPTVGTTAFGSIGIECINMALDCIGTRVKPNYVSSSARPRSLFRYLGIVKWLLELGATTLCNYIHYPDDKEFIGLLCCELGFSVFKQTRASDLNSTLVPLKQNQAFVNGIQLVETEITTFRDKIKNSLVLNKDCLGIVAKYSMF